jgi:hypothetical protein
MKNRFIAQLGCLFAVLGFVVSCAPKAPPRTSSKATTQPVDPEETPFRPLTPDPNAGVRPVIEYWDHNSTFPGRAPNLVFIIWSNGRVIRQVSGGRLYLGSVSPGELNLLLERFRQAGVFSSPLSSGVILPGGAWQLLWVDINGQQYSLRHDSSLSWADLEQYEPPASVSMDQVEAFVQMWFAALEAMDDIWPTKLEQIQGIPAIPYPGIR